MSPHDGHSCARAGSWSYLGLLLRLSSPGLFLDRDSRLEGERSCGKQSRAPGGTGNSALGPGILTSCLAWRLSPHIHTFGSDILSLPSQDLFPHL